MIIQDCRIERAHSEPLYRSFIVPVVPSRVKSSLRGADTRIGCGTGVFTGVFPARGIRERDLTLVEYGSDFMRMLQFRFPGARVLRTDAAHLAKCDLFPEEKAVAVVSGLPLLSMRPRKVMSILSGAFGHLRAGGSFYQSPHSVWYPVPRPILDRLGLRARRIAGTVLQYSSSCGISNHVASAAQVNAGSGGLAGHASMTLPTQDVLIRRWGTGAADIAQRLMLALTRDVR